MKANITRLVVLAVTAWFVNVECSVRADSRGTPETSALHTVQMAMQFFAKEHNGQMPTNWAQMGPWIDLDKLNRQTLGKSPAYPLQEHYVFANGEIPMLGYHQGSVVLISTGSFDHADSDIVSEGRYVISTNEGGFFYSAWISETNVQKMLAKAGITELPKPESLVQTNTAPEPADVSGSAGGMTQVFTPPVTQKPKLTSPALQATSPAVSQLPTDSPGASPAGPFLFAKLLVTVLTVTFVVGLGFLLHHRHKKP